MATHSALAGSGQAASVSGAREGNRTPQAQDVPRLDRVGLLASACADGRVRVFALPTDQSLTTAEPLLAHAARRATSTLGVAGTVSAPWRLWLPPVLILEPMAPVLTLSLDWCTSTPHLLACGLNDGTIAVWDLNEPARPPPETDDTEAFDDVDSDEDWWEDAMEDSDDFSDDGIGAADSDMPLRGSAAQQRATAASRRAASRRAAAAEQALLRHGRALGMLSLPLASLGYSSTANGELPRFYTSGSILSSAGLGHAGPGARRAADRMPLDLVCYGRAPRPA